MCSVTWHKVDKNTRQQQFTIYSIDGANLSSTNWQKHFSVGFYTVDKKFYFTFSYGYRYVLFISSFLHQIFQLFYFQTVISQTWNTNSRIAFLWYTLAILKIATCKPCITYSVIRKRLNKSNNVFVLTSKSILNARSMILSIIYILLWRAVYSLAYIVVKSCLDQSRFWMSLHLMNNKVCHREDTGSNSCIIVPWWSGIKYLQSLCP